MQRKFKIDLSGEMTLVHLQSYQQSLVPLMAEDIAIVLDMGQIKKIDMAGVQLILAFIRTRAKNGHRVLLDFHDNHEVRDFFHLIGADHII